MFVTFYISVLILCHCILQLQDVTFAAHRSYNCILTFITYVKGPQLVSFLHKFGTIGSSLVC